MAIEEKRAWIMVVVSAATYIWYAVTIAQRIADTPVSEVPYAATLLWTVAVSIVVTIVASIVVGIAAGITSPRDADRRDQRDREIARFGDHIGQSFLVIGGVAALLMALVEVDYFWIANAVYLAFVLSSLLGSAAKIAAYRFGLHPW